MREVRPPPILISPDTCDTPYSYERINFFNILTMFLQFANIIRKFLDIQIFNSYNNIHVSVLLTIHTFSLLTPYLLAIILDKQFHKFTFTYFYNFIRTIKI